MCISKALSMSFGECSSGIRPFCYRNEGGKRENGVYVCVCVYTIHRKPAIDSAAVANLAPNEQTAATKLKYDRRRESFAGAQVNGVAHGLPPHFKCLLVKIVLYTHIFISISLRQDLT